MRKIVALVLLVALASVSAAQPINKQINETNYVEVKSGIIQHLDERINKLLKFKNEVMNANNSEELKEVLQKQKLEIAKDRAVKFIDLAIKKLEKADESTKNATSELKLLKEKIKSVESEEELKDTMKEVRIVLTDLKKDFGTIRPKDKLKHIQ